MPVYLKLFNTVFDLLGTMPQTWCDGPILHQVLNLVLKTTHQTTGEFVFPVVVENYFAQFSIRDFLNTLTSIIYFTSLKFKFLTNRFHVAVHLFSNKITDDVKMWYNKEVAHEPQASVSLLFFLSSFSFLFFLAQGRIMSKTFLS